MLENRSGHLHCYHRIMREHSPHLDLVNIIYIYESTVFVHVGVAVYITHAPITCTAQCINNLSS